MFPHMLKDEGDERWRRLASLAFLSRVSVTGHAGDWRRVGCCAAILAGFVVPGPPKAAGPRMYIALH